MDLNNMFNELLAVPKDDLVIPGYDTSDINLARKAFLNSWRNTINKKIENTFDRSELQFNINLFYNKIEKALLISLYRRYLWLRPKDNQMYKEFINNIHPYEEQKLALIEQGVNENNYDRALLLVEEVFLSTFSDKTLIPPIKLRSFVDIVHEYYEIDELNEQFNAMSETGAKTMRLDYLRTILDERIEKETNPLELRAFFTCKLSFHILMTVDWGIKIGQRYFQLNPTDRELYEIYAAFLSFWAWPDKELALLNHIACNDFEKANELVQAVREFE